VRGAVALGLSVCLAASAAHAQRITDPVDEDHAEHRRTGELIAFGITAATYGLRVGTMIEWLADRRPNDGAPETFWILPGSLAIAGATGALLIDHYRPIRRGRAFSAGAGTLVGYLAGISLTMQFRGEALPSSATITGPTTFIGSTAGIATGILMGHLTDARPGQALYVATSVVYGTALGALMCGAVRCHEDLGAWAFTGELVGLGAALASVRALDPTAREMRLTAVGGIVGAFPAGAVFATYLSRDGGITEAAWQRVSIVGVGGLILGGVSGFAIARATRGDRSDTTTLAVIPSVPGALGQTMGLTVSGAL
jgi:hypothetical protein